MIVFKYLVLSVVDFKEPKTRYHRVMDLMNNADEEKRAIGEMMTVNSKV